MTQQARSMPVAVAPTAAAERPALEATGIVKRYGTVEALRGVSLAISSGEVLCVCGPNGAGKTTLLEIVQGSRRPDTGTIAVLGGPPDGARRRGDIGVLFQDGGAPDKCRVGELLELFQTLYPAAMSPAEALAAVDLVGSERRFFKTLSGGQRRRVLVAGALIGRAPLLLLDEPTSGLDPQSRERVWTAISAAAERGAAILATTHYLDEAEDYCDRVIVLSRGSVLAEGAARDVLDGRGLQTAVVVPISQEGRVRSLPGFARATDSRRAGRNFVVFFADQAATEEFTNELREALGGAVDMQVRRSRLEDLLLLAGDHAITSAADEAGQDEGS